MKPKLAIDLSRITDNKTGIEYYAYELAKALLDLGADLTLISNKSRYLDEFNSAKKVIIESEKPNLKWIRNTAKYLNRKDFCYFISPSYLTFSLFHKNTVQIVHDLAPVRFPQYWSFKARTSFKIQLHLASRRAKYFCTNSEYTRDDLIKYLPGVKNKTFAIGTGLNKWAYAQKDEVEMVRVKKKFNLPDNFILSVSTLQPRKNYENMLRAFAIAKEKNQRLGYVIAGKKGWKYESIFQTVSDLKLEKSVLFLGYVPEEDIAALYDLSKAVLYCSTFEGFGLPAIEAYARKKCVVLSNIPLFKGIMKENGIYVDPYDPEDIAAGINQAMNTELKFDQEFIDEFTWEKVGKNLLGVISKISL
ncbi:MAG: glycosyltransferase [Candidatus Dojkabacteria bacterium]